MTWITNDMALNVDIWIVQSKLNVCETGRRWHMYQWKEGLHC